ncbi:hypothetical protein O5O45_04445 [Hahella aquimaris]|uniref:hypothetical protein n=1 Tax=Hahella sp. HNIBRBA332 TaxID=3015983 RepID=UPI00273AF8F3|nr:hypothetical protein [Hahella sp. HNIBRBA332]WLQ15180.1 hypothetical protein O5O45_04445 [Hahella sp. HNIBRBA332]
MKVYIDAPLVAVALCCAVAASIAFERMSMNDDKHPALAQDAPPAQNPVFGKDRISGANQGAQPGVRPVALSSDYLHYPPLISDEAILELWAQNKKIAAPLVTQ